MSNGVPSGHHSVQPYLIFKNSKVAIKFYEKALGAVEELCVKEPDGRVSHASIRIGDSVVMMADENPSLAALSSESYGGSAVSLMVYTEDCDATYRAALAAGAHSLFEPVDQHHSDRMGGVRDPFGYTWYLATHKPAASHADHARM